MNTKDRKLDYSDQDIFCGIDVHKKSWKMTVSTVHTIGKTVSMERPFVENVLGYLEKNFPGGRYHAAYEAGFSGFWAQRALSKAGVDTIVVNAADIPTTNKQRDQKNDKRDSRKIATSLRSGELRGIYIPEVQSLRDRSAIRERMNVSKCERRVKHQIKSYLMFCGIEIEQDLEKRYWSRRYIKWLEKVKTEREDVALELMLERLEKRRQRRLQAINELRIFASQERHQNLYDFLISVPGVGLLTAMTLIGEIIDMGRFKTIDHLYSYVGFIPSTRSSGKTESVGEMTNRKNNRLLSSLIQASWISIKSDQELLMKYEQYRKGMKAQKAIIKIARILPRRIRMVWLKEQRYQKVEC